MIRADRVLLADLARLNTDVVPLAMQIMDDSATCEVQRRFAHRLIELGTRLNQRAHQTGIVIDGDIVTGGLENVLENRETVTHVPTSEAGPRTAETGGCVLIRWVLS